MHVDYICIQDYIVRQLLIECTYFEELAWSFWIKFGLAEPYILRYTVGKNVITFSIYILSEHNRITIHIITTIIPKGVKPNLSSHAAFTPLTTHQTKPSIRASCHIMNSGKVPIRYPQPDDSIRTLASLADHPTVACALKHSIRTFRSCPTNSPAVSARKTDRWEYQTYIYWCSRTNSVTYTVWCVSDTYIYCIYCRQAQKKMLSVSPQQFILMTRKCSNTLRIIIFAL